MLAAIIRFMKYRRKHTLVVLSVFACMSGINGMVSLTLSFVPVFIAFWVVYCRRKCENRLSLFTISSLLTGLLIGCAIYVFSMRNVLETNYIENAGTYRLLGIETWFDNLFKLPSDFLSLFFRKNTYGVQILSVEGVEVIVSIAIAIFVGVMPLYCIKRYLDLNDEIKLIVWYCVLTWAECLAQFILFRGHLPRLLWYGVCVNYTLIAVIIAINFSHIITLKRSVFFGIIVATWASLFPCAEQWKPDVSLIANLEHHALNYGFATFWNASCNTVLSKGRVKIRPIVLNEKTIRPMRYQSNQIWYDSANANGKDWFLLLTEDEWKWHQKNAANSLFFILAKKHFRISNIHVLTFPASCWNELLYNTTVEYDFKSLRFAKKCFVADDGRHIPHGGISFGPYLTIEKGRKCDVRITGKNLDRAHLRILARERGTLIRIEPAYSVKQENELHFSFLAENDLEKMAILIQPAEDDHEVVLSSEVIHVIKRN